MSSMVPAKDNQEPIYSVRIPSFAGASPTEFLFAPSVATSHTIHRSFTPHSLTMKRCKCYQKLNDLLGVPLEGPKSSILAAFLPFPTLTPLSLFFSHNDTVVTRGGIMAKIRLGLMQWRGVMQKLYLISNELDNIANNIRYAQKPSDLVYPITQLLQITRRLDVFRDQWLLKWLKSRSESLKNWPKLHERYL